MHHKVGPHALLYPTAVWVFILTLLFATEYGVMMALPVLLPGDMEEIRRKERSLHGVPMSKDAWASIVATARAQGIGEDAMPRPLA